MTKRAWKIGELARETGITVRTLHHYDRLGLVQPSSRTESGYRIDTAHDLVCLQQALSLRALGLSLTQIRDLLHARRVDPREIILKHREHLRAEIARRTKVCGLLDALQARLSDAGHVSPEQLLETIKEISQMKKVEEYYTPEQLAQLQARAEAFGPEAIREVEAEWPRLIAAVQAEMEKGTDPAAPEMQQLARRWHELVEMFTGGDPGIRASLKKLYEEQPDIAERQGGMKMDPALMEYVGIAMAADGSR